MDPLQEYPGKHIVTLKPRQMYLSNLGGILQEYPGKRTRSVTKKEGGESEKEEMKKEKEEGKIKDKEEFALSCLKSPFLSTLHLGCSRKPA